MAEQSNIKWTDSTFNPWEGCQKVGTGCDNCYAENRNARFAGGTAVNWGPGAPRRRTSASNWQKPITWNAQHEEFFAKHGRRRRVFCSSLADVFDNEVSTEWRADLWKLIESTPNLDWLLLTKRVGNVMGMVPVPWVSKPFQHGPDPTNIYPAGWPSHVWIGATIVNQAEADRDIPKLLAVPAAKRFLSMEPLLGPVQLDGHEYSVALGLGEGIDWLTGMIGQHSDIFGGDTSPWLNRDSYEFPKDAREPRIHWVIVGGESGPNARPMHPDWARSLRDQCQAAGVPFLFKQWGEWAPDEGFVSLSHPMHEWGEGDAITTRSWRRGKKAAGRKLDGRTWDEVPA